MNRRTVTLTASSASKPMMARDWANRLSVAYQQGAELATGLSTGSSERFCSIHKPSDCPPHPRISENAV